MRRAALEALRRGFTAVEDLQVQLAALPRQSRLLMLQGKVSLSTDELINCFVLPSASAEAAAEAGFDERSVVPANFEALLRDETIVDEGRRLQILQWCTALSALPPGGLRDNRIRIKLYADVDATALPNVHTCTYELHLPDYPTRELLRDKLFLAMEHSSDGFAIA